jgi:hypothetical protein
VTAIILGIRSGLADARVGRPPYLYGVLRQRRLRRELLRSGFETVVNLLLMGILLEAVCQWLILGASYPGAALVVGPVLIGGPYTFARALESLRALAQVCLTGGTVSCPTPLPALGERLSVEIETYGTSPLSFVVPDQYACLADGARPCSSPAGHAG